MLDHSPGGTPPEGIAPDGMTRGDFLKVAGGAGLLITASGTVLTVLNDTARAQETEGSFGPLFEEPYIYIPEDSPYEDKAGKRIKTTRDCWPEEGPDIGTFEIQHCKIAAGSNALLPDGRFLYVNALEGTENSESFGFDADRAIEDSESRVVSINYQDNTKSTFFKPFNSTGGKKNDTPSELVPGTSITSNRPGNNADLFCSSQCHLPGGSVLFIGGTNWYQEPAFVELEGNSGSRFFDWQKNRWFLTKGELNYGRWYPACVPLADGSPLALGGVHKLEKPIYTPPQTPGEPPFYDSGQNVEFIEKLNLETGEWEIQGGGENPQNTARISLPLQPRMKLLPNGHVSFNGAGQAFSPNGQTFDQEEWRQVKTYNPITETWHIHGFAGGLAEPGLGHYSTFEVPLLMEPDGDGNYKKMELLTAGGVLGVITNPGTYLAVNTSRIDTFTVDGHSVTYGPSRSTGPLNGDPTPDEGPPVVGRWFSDVVLLPDGKVFISSGSDRDEVIAPGAEFPVKTCELFDPETEEWTIVGRQTNPRTYHNTNSILPTGQVIIGGHAPIPFGYVSHDADVIPGTRNAESLHDPTFQIWSPPYIDDPNRPQITFSKKTGPNGTKTPLTAEVGGTLTIPTKNSAVEIEDVVLLRVPSTTHINDLEQRGVVLPLVDAGGGQVVAQMPQTLAELGGPGYYLAFLRNDAKTPSEGIYVFVPRKGQVMPTSDSPPL